MNKVPNNICQAVIERRFDYSLKAATFLINSRFTDDDLIHTVRFGNVDKKERDEKKQGRYKYTIFGFALDGTPMYLVGKMVEKRLFVITFHERR